jgi:hypothetical protein
MMIVEKLLADRQAAIEIGHQAAKDVDSLWNWNDYLKDLIEQYELCFPIERDVTNA